MTPFMVMTIFRTSLMYAIVTFTSESLFSYCSMTVFNSSTWQNPEPLGLFKNFLLLRYLKGLIYNSVAELR